MDNLIKRITDKLHRHQWVESCWNKYGVGMEETCKCGARRHHRDFKDDRNGIWRNGPNPIADDMRRKGITCNY